MIQKHFAEPNDPSSLDDTELVLHQKPGKTDDKALVIFVHGLGGQRYGDNSTWGRFPEYLYDDFQQLDVGLYEYRTLFKRVKFWKSVTLDTEAEVLGGIINDLLTDYKKIILMGHSMGGLLCMATICYLIETRQNAGLSRIGGLILMATPQLGSLRVSPWFGRLSRDFRALKPHGEFVAKIHRTVVNSVVLDESPAQPDKVNIPTWAVLGAYDIWVDELSAGLNLSSSRKRSVHGTHTEIVKPRNKKALAYQYVNEFIRKCLGKPVIRDTDSFPVALMKALEMNVDREHGPVRVRLKNDQVLVGSMAADTDDGIALFGWFQVEPGDAMQELAVFEKDKKFVELVEATNRLNLEIKTNNLIQQERPDNVADLIDTYFELQRIPRGEIKEGPIVVKATAYPSLDLDRPPLVLR